MFGGEPEVTSRIDLTADHSRVRADCITDTHYIEFGLDGTASARDSVHQAIFGADINDLQPMVVIIDRDGFEDTHQYEIERVAHLTGTDFRLVHANIAMRYAMTRHFRQNRAEIVGW